MGKEHLNGKVGDSSQPSDNKTPCEIVAENGGASTSGTSLSPPFPATEGGGGESEASSHFIQIKFKDVKLEGLYQNYSYRSRRDALWLCVVLCVSIDVTAIISSALYFGERQTPHLAVMGTFMVVNVAAIIILRLGVMPDSTHKVLPHILWLMMVVQLYVDVILGPEPVAPSLGVGWQVAIIYR